ncbi:MAG: CvpA family protein [Ruminococcaceae bacterium]|nr:CvpA family protein [Oscillospiraceae bacterium]
MTATYIFDIVLLVVLLFILIRSCVQGFFKTVFRSLRFVLSILAAYFLGKPIGEWMDRTFIHGWTYNGVYDKINGLYQSASESFNVQKILSSFPKFLIPQSMREQIENMDETGEALVTSASEAVSSAISHFISMLVSYILVFVLAWILLWLFTKIFGNIIHKIPVVGTVDHVLGAVLGLLIGWTLMSLICSLFRFFFSSSEFYTGSYVLKFFAENPITKYVSFLDFYALLSKLVPNN